MTTSAHTIWRPGVDDQLVREFLGGGADIDWKRFVELPAPKKWVLMPMADFHEMIAQDGPTLRAAPRPQPYQPIVSKPHFEGRKPYQLNFKEGFEIGYTAKETWKATKVVAEFGISTVERKGSRYFFEVTNSFVHKRRLRFKPTGTNRGSEVVRELRLAPFTLRGMVKGAFWDIVITGGGMGVDYAIARWWDHNEQAMEEIAGSFWKEMGKSALSSALGTAAVAAAAAATGVVFVPIVVGLVVGVSAGCVLDELDGQESKCSALGRAIGNLFSMEWDTIRQIPESQPWRFQP